jgi:hypothetical protein
MHHFTRGGEEVWDHYISVTPPFFHWSACVIGVSIGFSFYDFLIIFRIVSTMWYSLFCFSFDILNSKLHTHMFLMWFILKCYLDAMYILHIYIEARITDNKYHTIDNLRKKWSGMGKFYIIHYIWHFLTASSQSNLN